MLIKHSINVIQVGKTLKANTEHMNFPNSTDACPHMDTACLVYTIKSFRRVPIEPWFSQTSCLL